MSVILMLILVSLGLATLFLFFFIWAVNSGQYEDTLTPSLRMLTEDDSKQSRISNTEKTKQTTP